MYGKCIVADYNHVHKDKCLTEFMKLKECYNVCTLLACILNITLTAWTESRKTQGMTGSAHRA